MVFVVLYRIKCIFLFRATKKAKEKTAPSQISSVCETYIEPSAIALYDYEPTAIDDLSFNVGDAHIIV